MQEIIVIYQGQEKDDEIGFEAFELRQWDGRIGRWMTIDPKHQFSSPYVGMGNNPINGVDPDGGWFDDFISDGNGGWTRIGDGLGENHHRFFDNFKTTHIINTGSGWVSNEVVDYVGIGLSLEIPKSNISYNQYLMSQHINSAKSIQQWGNSMTTLGVGMTVGSGGLLSEVGVPLMAGGAGAGLTGGLYEISARWWYGDFDGGISKMGWMATGMLLDAGLSRIPGVDPISSSVSQGIMGLSLGELENSLKN